MTERKARTEGIGERRPLIHGLYAFPLSGPEIEAGSFAIIDREAPSHSFPPEEWQVVRRMVHTAGEFGLIQDIRFSPRAISSAVAALRAGRPIFVDSNMIRSGLSLARLRAVCADYGPERLICHVADEDVAEEARQSGLPRSLFAVRKAKPFLDGAIAVFGNAPVALLELNRMILEENVRPALVVAMPVGFLHVVESKQELMSLKVPYIAVEGRRGGSPLAVSVIHALCSLADSKKNRIA
jgi:precorrin-8X/cobalt-precorrin-8 methylmutase